MSLPFTPGEFFDVFRRYNEAVWPLQVLFTAMAAAAFALVLRGGASGRAISAILALLWAWMGVVYHLVFFLRINPAAALFGVLFLCAAALFAWEGVVKGRLRFERAHGRRDLPGYVLVGYALFVYPALSYALGREAGSAPTFGLPCPTTIFTIGMLGFLKPPFARSVLVVPLLWTLIGMQAAWLLGVYEDLGLAVAGLAALWLALPPCRERIAA